MLQTQITIWLIIYAIISVAIVVNMFRVYWLENNEHRPLILIALFCAGMIQVSKMAAIISQGSEGYFAASKIEYLGKCFACAFMISFITKYYHVNVPKIVMSLTYAISIGFFFVVLTDDYHHLYYSAVSEERLPGSVDFGITPGPLHSIFMGFLFLILIAYVCVCVSHYKSEGKYHKEQGFQFVLLLGGIIPFVGVGLYLSGATNGTDLTPVTVGISIFAMSFAVTRYGMFDPVRFAESAAITSTNTGIIVFDRHRRYIYSNEVARTIFPNVDFDASMVECYELDSLFATPGRVLERKDRYYEVNTTEIRNHDRLEGYLAYLIDVSDIFRRNKQLDDLLVKAEDNAAAKGAFLANMSHEIRTPLNGILGMSQMAMAKKDPGESFEYIERIKGAAESLLVVVNDILDVSKIEFGKFTITEAPYDLRKMLDDVSHLVEKAIMDKGLRYTTHIDDDVPERLVGDDIRIKQVLINLINNAIKYTDKGSVSVSVSVNKRVDSPEVYVEFSVRDSGIGIRTEDRERIFKNFEQTDSYYNHSKEGSGLGLSICKQLVTLMHGSIDVDSIYGKGSRFFFEIPQKIDEAGAIARFKKKKFKAPGARALVMDDSEVNRQVAEGFLGFYDIQTDTAEDGESGIAMTENKEYDIILVDRMMPGIDGIETCARLKASGTKAVLVALTGDVTDESVKEITDAGFDYFLPKPLGVEDLEKCLLSVLPENMIIKET